MEAKFSNDRFGFIGCLRSNQLGYNSIQVSRILRQAKNSGSFFEKRDMMLTLVFLTINLVNNSFIFKFGQSSWSQSHLINLGNHKKTKYQC